MSPPPSGARLYGVLGWPLRHTLSPAIQAAAFEAARLDAVYLPFPVPPERLSGALTGLAALGARGVNVTAPHKEEAARFADVVRDPRIGAVNTLSFDEGRVVGDNTDVEAFGGFLEEETGFDAHGRSALVLGSGGAARACVAALGRRGVGRLVVAARRASAAGEVIAVARGAGHSSSVGLEEAATLSEDMDLLVNATSLGWEGEEVPLRPRGRQVVVDLVYAPTPLLAAARAAGAEAHDGLGMLVRQAALAFEIWTGISPPVAAMVAAADDARRRG